MKHTLCVCVCVCVCGVFIRACAHARARSCVRACVYACVASAPLYTRKHTYVSVALRLRQRPIRKRGGKTRDDHTDHRAAGTKSELKWDRAVPILSTCCANIGLDQSSNQLASLP